MAASVRDVAVTAGVSVGTVSNVLNRPEKVAAATVKRVHEAIAALGFVRNDAARQLRAGRSRSIGMVVPDVANPFFAAVVRGAEDRAAEAGMSVFVAGSAESGVREAAHLDLFQEQRVSGVLITPTAADADRLGRLRDAGTGIVLLDRQMPGGAFASVSVDDVEGGRLAVDHLLVRGHRRIAFIGGLLTVPQVAERLAGAREALADVDGAALEVIAMPTLTVLEGRRAGEEIAGRPERERPEAVFCANDLLAVGVMQALVMTGDIRIPEDIALIGYDDISFASASVVPLSSIRQPAEAMGAAAVELLLRELSDTSDVRTVRFRPELVARQSTASQAGVISGR